MSEFHRTNINLYLTDVQYLQQKYGQGWTERVREMVHKEIRNQKELDSSPHAKTIEQLINEHYRRKP